MQLARRLLDHTPTSRLTFIPFGELPQCLPVRLEPNDAFAGRIPEKDWLLNLQIVLKRAR
jgi:hypothetical protein